MNGDEFSQDLALSDTQSHLCLWHLADANIFENLEVLEVPHICFVGVDMLKNFVVNEMARINVIKVGDAHTSGSMKGTTMTWAQSSLVLNKMCDLIPNRVKTEKDFKEVQHQHFL
jgi:hypothetical protein